MDYGMRTRSAGLKDEEVFKRVQDNLRSIGVDVQCLMDLQRSEIRQLSKQIKDLKSEALATTEVFEIDQPRRLTVSPDYTLIVPTTPPEGSPPGMVGPPSVKGAWDGSKTDGLPAQMHTKPDLPDAPLELSAREVIVKSDSEKILIPAPVDEKRTHRECFRKKLMEALDSSPHDGSRRASTISGDSHSSDGLWVPPVPATLLPDANAMKEKVRDAITRPEYSVADFYYKTGYCQAIATHPWFEPITLLVIAFNAIWAAIDIDYNKEALLSDAHPIFQIAEHSFCAFFVAEWTVRFLSFRRKRDCLRDSWFVFDTVLAFAFALETWFMVILALFVDLGNRGVLGNASILRLFRLMRLNRMGRLVRIVKALPEMLIVIKGIGVAFRSVFFTLCLLVVVLYVFGIGFRTLAGDTALERRFFPTVPAAMLSLLLGGIFAEYEDTVREIGGINLLMGLLFGLFMFITTITLMNFLIGVLVEAVSAVAVTEKEELTVKFVKAHMLEILEKSGIDEDNNKHLSKSEFETMLLNPATASAMQAMGVDVVGLTEFGEVLFQDDNELSFPDFIRLVLQLRGTNPTTVKDIVDLRKFVLQELASLEDYIVQVIQECMPKQKSSLKTNDRRKTVTGNALQKVLTT